jgi:hypothetical protein
MPLAERLLAHSVRRTVYTHLSNSRRDSFSDERFSSGNEGVSRKNVPQARVDRFADADAGGNLDVSGAEAVVSDPQAGGGRSEIAAVVAGAGDAESFGEAPRAAGETGKALSFLDVDLSSSRHFFNAEERFEGAEKNSPGLARGVTGHVEAIVTAVDEVNVGVAGRSEQDCSARGVAGSGVGRGIVFSEVSFHFDDAGCQMQVFVVAHQHLAEEFASHAPRIAGEEGAIEGAYGRMRGGRGHRYSGREIAAAETAALRCSLG